MEHIKSGTGWNASPNVIDLDASLSIYEKSVWHNFNAHVNNETGNCFPSKETQAKEIGCCKDKVCEARKTLEQKGWLSKEQLTDKKTGRFIRFQWVLRVPSSALPDVGKNRRRKLPTTANKDANKKKLKQQEEIKQEEDITTGAGAPEIKVETAEGRKINELIKEFEPVNPSYARFYKILPQRDALDRLLKIMPAEELVKVIKFLPKSNISQYAPTITTPLELEKKLGSLKAFCERQKEAVSKNATLVAG